ncbi:MAG: 2-oxoglutarate dehydrogenase E1 component [Bacteroidetes bacterium]|nr:2-oxoglutarate dehydrogenase E1 component [Bacteroidota bacterium]
MDNNNYLSNLTPDSIDELYKKYRNDNNSVDIQWKKFFEGFEFAQANYPAKKSSTDSESPILRNEFNVIDLINAYRERGHLFTKTNPVRVRRKYSPTLDIENFGLTENDLNTRFKAGNEIGIGDATLKEIVEHLQKTYCQSIGVEYMYIRTPEIVEWLRSRMERSRNKPSFSIEKKKEILKNLIHAVEFEQFLNKRFTGQKRFSLEGCESLIPALNSVIEKGSELGLSEFVIGMAHRGRLNVLGNILKKPFHELFSEFEGKEYDDETVLGDVKYHLGCTLEANTKTGANVKLSICPNPSHLETVDPVVEGLSRAKIDLQHNEDYKKLMPILIHGDAAMAGQGIVYEVIQMSKLDGFKTGGTLHLVINNQLGFTTNYTDARSSTYCTDVAKTIQSPIFHVNGDDVEAVVYTIELALEFRQRFNIDVYIDLLCYRKYGHNESDEPRFTQPVLYKAIAKHPNPANIYLDKLLSVENFNNEIYEQIRADYLEQLDNELEIAKRIEKNTVYPFLENIWKPYRKCVECDTEDDIKTTVNQDVIKELGNKITQLPKGMPFFNKTARLMQERNYMINEAMVLDWAMGEALAYASLLNEGVNIRISGQDVERGTFSHRHAVLKMEDSELEYIPLSNISEDQGKFEIYNSLLSEYGVLGFEYGYALGAPQSLVIWEAQFGDFFNGAQIIIDNYLSGAEEKWKISNGLVMYLPHGFEGQGPEHSSARMERFLTMCANNNMQIVNCTTPANLFHLLRRQIKRDYRKPLILFSPKSTLRHPACVSSLDELSSGRFNEVIDDNNAVPEKVERIIICTGKIYYDLLSEKESKNIDDTAIIRLEQIYPLPFEQLEALKKKYLNAKKIIWVQEEPENMGAWPFLKNHLGSLNLSVIARPPSASPASGSSQFHKMQQRKIVEKSFEECDCDDVCRECKQLCISHLKNS